MSITQRARPEIQALVAYSAAAQVTDTIRLNANESPHTNSASKFRRPLNRYPEVRPQRLQQALASRFGCHTQQLLVTRGSSEAIDLLIRAFCTAGVDNVLAPSPSFEMYRHYAAVQGAEIIQVATRAEHDFAVDVQALIDACTANTKVIFVCSPNNPTGTPLPRSQLVRLLEARRETSAVVVDEAYIEFGRESSAIEMMDSYPNLLVLRTLSKALGFAGARCGAVAASADVIAMLSAVQAPYALATPVVECVEDALQAEQIELANQHVEELISERERLRTAVSEYGFVQKVWPSEANFFLIKADDALAVVQHCSEHKILLRYFGDSLPGCIRISIGTRIENDRLLAAFDSIQKDLS